MKCWLTLCILLSCSQSGATEAVACAYQNAEMSYTLLGYSKTLNTIVTTTPEQNCIRIHTGDSTHELSCDISVQQAVFLNNGALFLFGSDKEGKSQLGTLSATGSLQISTPADAPEWFRLTHVREHAGTAEFTIQGAVAPTADAPLYKINPHASSLSFQPFHDTAPGSIAWAMDGDGILKAALRWNKDGSKTLEYKAGSSTFTPILQLPTANRLQLVGINDRGRILLLHDYQTEHAVLAEYDPATGQLNNISNGKNAEISGILPRTDGTVLGYCTMREKLQYHPLRPCGLVSDFLRGLPQESSARMVAVSDDESKLLVWVSENSGPFRLMMYSAGKGCVPLERSAAPVPPTRPTQFAEYPAADGTRIPVYYTLPDGKGPFPTVIFVHGGPRMRTDDSYDWRVQYLVSQGFAVVQPQFRGSRGWGSSFMHAGNRQWGKGCIQTDVNDAIPWLIRQGIAQPNKIAIFGGSYGGYAVTAALAFTPGLYTCGISLFGPQDLMLHLQKMNGMDAPFAGEDSLTIGDISTAEGRAHLRSISPVYHADNFQEPLLLYYGGKDTLIPPEHSQRLYKALRAAGKDVTLVTYPDEAHGFADPAHEPQLYARHVIPFLNKHLNKHPLP